MKNFYLLDFKKEKRTAELDSLKDLTFGLIDNTLNGCTMHKILYEFGIPKSHLITLNKMGQEHKKIFSPPDIIIIGQDAVTIQQDFIRANADVIWEYVKKGGILWLMHQGVDDWDPDWPRFLPPSLANVRLINKYVDRLYTKRFGYKQYVGPWIMQRNHPIWNKPNYVDGGSFMFWDIDNKHYETAATAVVLVKQKEWDILAKFADNEIMLSDKGAIILQAKYGRGFYFWTQLLSPQLVWNKKCFERESWEKFLENILTYFKDFKKGKVLEVDASSNPWSLTTNEEAKIIAKIKGKNAISEVSVKIKKPGCRLNKWQTVKVPVGKHLKIYQTAYCPSLSGNHRVEVYIKTKDGKEGIANTSFKVTKGWTAYRFLMHVHTLEWSEPSPGLIHGACHRLGIDAVVLSQTRPNALKPEDISSLNIDNPAVRFFFGVEYHPWYFTTKGRKVKKGFPHFLAFNLPDAMSFRFLSSYGNCYNSKYLKYVQETGGIIIIAHPDEDRFWDREGFDNIEFFERRKEGRDRDWWDKNWDRRLKEGKLLYAIPCADNLGIQELKITGVGLAWIKDKPFNLETLIDACKSGRVVKVGTQPHMFAAANYNLLWFDVNGQPGEVIYSSGKVELHIRAKNIDVFNTLKVIKDGEVIRNIKINSTTVDLNIFEKITSDTYFRVELYPAQDLYKRANTSTTTDWRNIWYTNPIFVKKIDGPQDSYFYIERKCSGFIDKTSGRWIDIPPPKIIKTSFKGDRWIIELDEPSGGKLIVKWDKIKRIKLNNRDMDCRCGNIANIPLIKRRQTIILFSSVRLLSR